MGDFRVTIFGAGNLGSALAAHLTRGAGGFAVEILDPSEQALDRLRDLDLPVARHLLPHEDSLVPALKHSDVVVAAAPEWALPVIARAAASAGTHYLDFSPPRAATIEILAPLARRRVVLNGCGVSPGLVGNIARSLLARCAPAGDLSIRVGAVPRYPTNRLGYGQIWDIDGLIDEYTQPCEALRDGEVASLAPLENLEHVAIDGVTYEAFTTSRGLAELDMFRLAGLRNVTFKTLRYPGHLDHMKFLLDDLGLRGRRDMLRSLLLNGLPIVDDDVLILLLTARGDRGARKVETSVSYRFRRDAALGPFNTMTSVAAGYAAALLSRLKDGALGASGVVAHREIEVDALMRDRFLAPLLAA